MESNTVVPPPAPESPQAPAPNPPSEIVLTVDGLLRRITPTAWVTPFISVGLLLAFGYEIFLGAHPINPTAQSLVDAGASYGAYILDGEPWRLFTAPLLHAGLIHLLLNLWAFWIAGLVAERLFGNLGFLALYLLAGLGGSLLSVAMKPESVSVGASGAIFGVYGALLAFMMSHRGVLPPEFLAEQRNSLLGFLAYNLIYGFTQPNIDMWGHAGGFVTGCVAGLVLSRDLLKPAANLRWRLVGALCLAGALAVAGEAALKRLHSLPAVEAEWHSRIALRHLDAERVDAAIEEYDQALALDPNGDWTWWLNRGVAHLKKNEAMKALADMRASYAASPTPESEGGQCDAAYMAANLEPAPLPLDEAARICQKAKMAKPKEARLFAKAAILEFMLEEFEACAEDARRGVELDPSDLDLRLIRAAALQHLERSAEAAAECTAGKVAPESSDYQRLACLDAYWSSKDWTRALPLLNTVVDEAGDDAGPLVNRASLLENLGRFRDSLADLDAADALTPENPLILNNRAWIKVLLEDFPAAEVDVRRSLQLRPDDPFSLGTLCYALAGQGKREPARAACARSLQLRPESELDSAMLSFLEGKAAQAVETWSKAVEKNPALKPQVEPWLARAQASAR